jgi:flagellar biosynthesis protein FliQ
LAVFVVTILFLPFMLNSMKSYVINLFKIMENLK